MCVYIKYDLLTKGNCCPLFLRLLLLSAGKCKIYLTSNINYHKNVSDKVTSWAVRGKNTFL